MKKILIVLSLLFTIYGHSNSINSLTTAELSNMANEVYAEMLVVDPWSPEYAELINEYEYIIEVLRARAKSK